MQFMNIRLGSWLMILINLMLLAQFFYNPSIASFVVTVFWLQSVLLGVETILKILFTSSRGQAFKKNGDDANLGFVMNLFVAGFFTFHFGVFIMVTGGISFALMKDWTVVKVSEFAFPTLILILTGVLLEWPRKLKGIRRNSPGIATLMFAPYIRLIPLAIIIFGSQTLSITATVVLFIGAKLLAEWLYFIAVDKQLYEATEKE